MGPNRNWQFDSAEQLVPDDSLQGSDFEIMLSHLLLTEPKTLGLRPTSVSSASVKEESNSAITSPKQQPRLASKMAPSATVMTEGDVLASMSGGASTEEGYKENLNEILICPDCRNDPPNLVEEFASGDMVCGDCGLVLGDRIIDTRSEWRTFANDDQGNDDPSRVGDAMNPLLNGSQLETSIAFTDGSRSKELHRAQNRSQTDKATKSLLEAYKAIGQLCDHIDIPKSVQDSAKHIFKLTDDAKIFKGKPQDVIIAGCIFVACRQAKVARTFREIFALTNVSKKEIGRTFKQLEKFLQSNKEHNTSGSFLHNLDNITTSNATTADALCGRFCNNLNFARPHLMEKVSSSLAQKSSSVKDLAGRSPLSVAAACIYMASHLMGEPKPSKDIALVAGVSDGTIKTAYRFLFQARESLIDPAFLAPRGAGDMSRLPSN